MGTVNRQAPRSSEAAGALAVRDLDFAVFDKEYLDRRGVSPFTRWFDALNAAAAAKVTTGLLRLELGNLSNVKGVGAGGHEYRIDFGPGYRIYFGRDGETIVVLLAGGTKKRQSRDISTARIRWNDYKRRRSEEV